MARLQGVINKILTRSPGRPTGSPNAVLSVARLRSPFAPPGKAHPLSDEETDQIGEGHDGPDAEKPERNESGDLPRTGFVLQWRLDTHQ
jgi:hypothetical protein